MIPPFRPSVVQKLILPLCLLAGLSACREEEERVPLLTAPVLSAGTGAGRRESLAAVRSAWRERPRATTSANERAERRFLNSFGSFMQSISSSREFDEACFVWNDCIRDHTRQYGDPD